MQKIFFRNVAALLLSLFTTHDSRLMSQSSLPFTRILFLLDGSYSMNESFGNETKISAAREIISNLVDSLLNEPKVEMALRVYGHQYSLVDNNCDDTKLEVPFGAANAPYIRQTLADLHPRGVTPLAISLEQCAKDFPPDVNARNIVMLITDGSESCSGDPCAASLALQQQRIVLRPFVIGLNLDFAQQPAMECIGTFFNAKDPVSLNTALVEVVHRILSSTTVRINLLDVNGKPLETDVNMSFSDAWSGMSKYNFMHTLNYRGIPDTLSLDPVTDYDLVIHTTPPIRREHLHFTENKSDTLNIPAAQGFLRVELLGTTFNKNLNNKIKCMVRRAGTYETITVLDINSTAKLLTGRYDIEVLTLPRMQIENVEVVQSSTTTMQIPAPGAVNVSRSGPGYGGIFYADGNRLVKIYQFKENLTGELVGLQPGNYVVIYRSRLSKKSTDTVEKKITITGSQSVLLKL